MTQFKILEFKKSQYSYDAIENALSQKVSEGWKVISLHTDVSTDLKGIVVALLQQVTPGEEKPISYTDEDVENKRREMEIRRMEAETRSIENRGPLLGVAAMTMANNGIMGGSPMAGAATSTGWTCTCGQTGNQSRFCMNCGNTKPDPVPTRTCPKCGWKSTDGQTIPKFCPDCGMVL